MAVASTSSPEQSIRSRSQSAGGTAKTIRSCDSEIQISVYDSPAYFSGALSSSTAAPSASPISPTAELKPPAPQSVMALYKPASRACNSTSSSFFSAMALPICTAPPLTVSDSAVSSTDENVAP